MRPHKTVLQKVRDEAHNSAPDLDSAEITNAWVDVITKFWKRLRTESLSYIYNYDL